MFAISKDILYSIAKTLAGKLVLAVDASKDVPYTCLVCSQPLILRKGLKKRPHFAHKNLTPNCSAETALHSGFKTLLHNKIQHYIDHKQPLEIQWDCGYCDGMHTGNLLKKAVQVKLEYRLGKYQPDIALLDSLGRSNAVIEVIVTHAPEEEVLEYYRENKIAVVCYVLKSDKDIERLDSPHLKPDSVDLCLNPKCPECGGYMAKKCLLIIDGKCWKCRAPMKVAALRGDMGYEGGFSASDVKLAKEHGVFLAQRYSRTAQEKYVANECRNCGAFIGDHYLFTDYVAVSSYAREEFDAGYYCPQC